MAVQDLARAMGSLRFILAMSVVYGHTGDFLGFPFIPGDTAVQVFYAVSGFYMALVLNEKYRPPSSGYLLFISNRFLRLFPVYAAVLCLTLLLAVAVAQFSSGELTFVKEWHSIAPLDWWSTAFLAGTQIVMWGQDLYLFLTIKGGALAFLPKFTTDPHPLYQLLVIPQGWTLGLEFSFYLLAPFIVRRSLRTIALVLAASLLLRLFLQLWFGYSGDPWSYRFFPSELAVFLLGALAYRIDRTPASADRLALPLFLLAVAALGAALLINRWHGIGRLASVSFLMLACAAIPILFRSSKDNLLDRHLGELSYPIYICHILVIWFLDFLVPLGSTIVRGICIIAATLLASSALYLWIDRPVDRWRQRRFELRRGQRPAARLPEQPALAVIRKPLAD
jgi:peptidoglycan/LPS O-acetylase OafA/YrhL